jgi:meso-butanediol dehydrogenase/(S,S)-butanediol dehydrogenase/diacetyl reductase
MGVYDLTGRKALVTGGARGLGAGMAEALARAGAAVMIGDVLEDTGQATVGSIRESGATAGFVTLDVTDEGSWEAAMAKTIAELGGLDVLINNAGILYTANALDTSDAQWLDTMAVNLNAVFYLSRAAVKHMKAAGKGAIVNIASEWGLNGEADHVAYCASKGAVIQITRCMALDHARDNIRVNSVCPGEIHTRMVDDILAKRGGNPQANLKQLAAGIPMRRLAQPIEVARCVHFLASDLASYVTGTNLSVDGGNDATAGPYP